MTTRDQPMPDSNDAGNTPESSGSGSTNREDAPVLPSSIGSGLLARQPTPEADEQVAVVKVCPQCGGEYETGDRFCPRDGAPLRPKGGNDPLIGRVIADRYLILAKLGEGGMGRVYVAEHVKMNRQCAIKVMSPSLINDGESTTRFAREASNAARVLHPNVAAVFDYGESDRMVYLVMEYVDGDSLSRILARDGALDPRRAIDIARQIADGLFAAHELGLIHRDLKPDNVIVARRRDGRETAKVVDFGIAKAVSDAPQDSLTRSGLVIGTPEYMSPEQLLGDPVDARTDIYALGCMLFQMLTGARPFEADSREQMLRRRLHEPPPHIRDLRPELPRRLDTLIAHMLARSPGDRLASAAEVSAQLDPALALSGWDPSSLRAPARSNRVTPTITRLATDPAMRPTVRLTRRSDRVTRVVVGIVMVGVIALGGLRLWPLVSRAQSPHNDTVTTPSLPPIVLTQPSAAPLPADSHGRPANRPKHPPAERQTAAQTPEPPAQDSVAEPVIPTPTQPESEDAALHEPLERFAVAMGNGEVAIRSVFPGMPQALLDPLKTAIFAKVQNITATASYGPATIYNDTAELDYTLRLSYHYRDSGAPGTATLHYRATLARHGDLWEITDLVTKP